MFDYNYTYPTVTALVNKQKDFACSFIDAQAGAFEQVVQAYDKLTFSYFTTYTSVVNECAKDLAENAKEIIKTGQFKTIIETGNKK